jgi:hypothetical protein
MARNLQAKLPSSDTMKVYDINPAMVERFANDTKALTSGAAVQAVDSVRDAAEDSVRCLALLLSTVTPHSLCDEFVLSMI